MIEETIEIAKSAGSIIMQHYKKNNIEFTTKKDNSPVSVADIEANEFICFSLRKIFPSIDIISEESENNISEEDLFWTIDPLDGTKGFLNKQGNFTVNIALIKDKKPIFGVVHSPLTNETYFNNLENKAFKQIQDNQATQIKARKIPKEGAIILVSASLKNHQNIIDFFSNIHIEKIIPSSSALKICSIAAGEADIYPRFGQTMEWDTAAGHAILTAAGGTIKNLNEQELTYSHRENNYTNPHFIARGLL